MIYKNIEIHNVAELIYNNDGRYVIVKAGEISDTIYQSEDEAKTALGCVEDNAATAEDETNYTSEEKGGFTVYTFNN